MSCDIIYDVNVLGSTCYNKDSLGETSSLDSQCKTHRKQPQSPFVYRNINIFVKELQNNIQLKIQFICRSYVKEVTLSYCTQCTRGQKVTLPVVGGKRFPSSNSCFSKVNLRPKYQETFLIKEKYCPHNATCSRLYLENVCSLLTPVNQSQFLQERKSRSEPVLQQILLVSHPQSLTYDVQKSCHFVYLIAVT